MVDACQRRNVMRAKNHQRQEMQQGEEKTKPYALKEGASGKEACFVFSISPVISAALFLRKRGITASSRSAN
jgi:hypothetical protein